ncbi:MAG: acyl-CoA dehydrogenase family protein, partial [Actinomycetota bacterium]
MAMSFSRPDPSSPTAVSAAMFATSRKGFEQAEVRDFLRMVAAELARLQEREKFLERELRSMQRGNTNANFVLDEEVVTRMLGEEAARILSTAREAASQIKIRAEENASRVLREATDEAQRQREEAEIEASRRRQDASADAEAEISMAKKYSAQVFNRLVDTCLQVHGGMGYMHESRVSRAFRDARLQRIGAGTDEIMNEVIAKRLGIV